MDFAGLVALIFILMYVGLPGKVKKLTARVKRLESNKMGGEWAMSEMLKELVGKKCTLVLESDFSPKVTCVVQMVDDEWIKVVETDKKGHDNVRMHKIENVKEVVGIE